ncbi:MAG: DUF6049 family protein, partial [Microthrixaceae bacterium]
GAQVTSEVIGAPGDDATWTLDDTVTTESLGLLASLGVEGVVVPASMLALGGGLTEEQVSTRAVSLDGGDRLRAIAYDGALSQRLADSSVEAGVRAHEVVSLLMATWFTSQRDDRPAASVILVPATIDAAVLEALTPSLSGGGPLLADTSAPILPAAGPDEPRAELRERDVPDQRGAVTDSTETRRQIAAYQSMVGTTNPAVSLWDRLNAETLATGMDAAERAALRDTIRGQIAAALGAIQPPRERRILLTSREQTIPLRLRNDLPYDVRLLLRARSPRLNVEGGESRTITLAPGDNRIELPVSVQAPGESLLRIELSTPDDGMQLASIDVPVRSTAISGVGAALSVVSVVFLVLWWIHTHRRRRREQARANGSHPAGGAPPPRDPSRPSQPSDPSDPSDDHDDDHDDEAPRTVTTADSTPASVRTDSVAEGG